MRLPQRTAVLVVGLGVSFATSCGSDPVATTYSSETRDGFIAACSDSVSDSRLLSEICGCAYEELEDAVEYSTFVELEEELLRQAESESKSEPELPDEVVSAVSNCIIAEAKLD